MAVLLINNSEKEIQLADNLCFKIVYAHISEPSSYLSIEELKKYEAIAIYSVDKEVNLNFNALISLAKILNQRIYFINYKETDNYKKCFHYDNLASFYSANTIKEENNNDDYKNLTKLLAIAVFDKSSPSGPFSTSLQIDFDVVEKFYKEHNVTFDNIDGEKNDNGERVCTITYELKDKKKITRKGKIS